MQKPLNIFTPPTNSYWQFIWKVRTNRILLLAGLGTSVLLFCILKIFYPFPDFFGDSYSYIYAASHHLDINIWPIGYSKFLAAFHALTYSGTALVAFQYFSMQIAILHFLFTVLYFYNLQGWHRNALAIFLVFNPLTLYLCNTVNSDALFGFLSLLWITELIWTVQRPNLYRLFTHAILLFLCFTVRNNAYYYPLVAAAAFLLSGQKVWRKAAGIALPFLFIIPFILYSRDAAFKLTGTRQFSLFTGWQLANNALYMYDQIDVDSADLPTAQARSLNRYAIQFFRRVKPEVYRDALESAVGNFFIREPEAPLKQYYGSHYIFTDEKSNIINWAHASEVFEPFGKTLILQHPLAYMEYFVAPNVKHYFIPPLSHVGLYNYGLNEIDPAAAAWFHYPNNKIRVSSHTLQGQLLQLYIGLFLLLNVYYALNILRFAFRGSFSAWRTPAVATQVLLLAFLVINFGFSIASTVNILRYQYIPMIALAGFGLTLGYYLEPQVAKPKARARSYTERYGITEPNTF